MKLIFKKTAPKPVKEEAEYAEYEEGKRHAAGYGAPPPKKAAPVVTYSAKPGSSSSAPEGETTYSQYARVGKPKTKKVPVHFPKQGGPRAESPTIWHRGLAGVSLSRSPGRGEKLLDRICAENGWTWGITTSFTPETGVVRVDVLIGTVVSGQAESLQGNDGMRSWDELDEALGAVAKAIGAEEG
jgi:hypothetical protein